MKSIIWDLMHRNNKRIRLRILVLTAYYRIRILVVPMRWQRRRFGIESQESAYIETNENYQKALWVARMVDDMAFRTPWQSKCLVRALTASKILHDMGIATTMYLGVGTIDNIMVAHAWLRCGEIYVSGGDGKGYAKVACFKKE